MRFPVGVVGGGGWGQKTHMLLILSGYMDWQFSVTKPRDLS